jgi:hypothetical protein
MQIVAYLRYALPKRGAPPGHNKLIAIGSRLAGEPSRSEEQTWLMTAIYKIVREGEDPARALELKWPRRGRPTGSLRRDSIELDKAVFMVRHIEADPKPRGATKRAVDAAVKEYGSGRRELEKILAKRREDATYELEQEYHREEGERREREAADAERWKQEGWEWVAFGNRSHRGKIK